MGFFNAIKKLWRKYVSKPSARSTAKGPLICGLPEQKPLEFVYMAVSAWTDRGPFGMAMPPSAAGGSIPQTLEYMMRMRLGTETSPLKYYIIKVKRTEIDEAPQQITAVGMYRIIINNGVLTTSDDIGGRTIEFTTNERAG